MVLLSIGIVGCFPMTYVLQWSDTIFNVNNCYVRKQMVLSDSVS